MLITVTKQPYTSTIDLTETPRCDHRRAQCGLSGRRGGIDRYLRQSRFIDSSINNIKTPSSREPLFVVLVLLVFLMNGRVTLISLTAMPLSLLITVIVMRLTGHTINTMSLGGMAIAIGSLVDDAIIDVENVSQTAAGELCPSQSRTGEMPEAWFTTPRAKSASPS